ncbi:pyrroloquinoline quinone biosynthesis protein PqqB, partial [Streptomyces sp. A7024]
MLVHVLGTAAGGGVPQWNCACPGCAGARVHALRRRRHDALALQAAPGRYYLVGAGPDLGEQLADCPDLHPGPGPRETPVAGVILTDAELDHTLGLARLREAGEVELLATRPVLDAVMDKLALGATLFPYTKLTTRSGRSS